jgi:hypothetical protein
MVPPSEANGIKDTVSCPELNRMLRLEERRVGDEMAETAGTEQHDQIKARAVQRGDDRVQSSLDTWFADQHAAPVGHARGQNRLARSPPHCHRRNTVMPQFLRRCGPNEPEILKSQQSKWIAAASRHSTQDGSRSPRRWRETINEPD